MLRFQASTMPTWDRDLANELVLRLALDPTQRATRLSRGQAGKLALVLALAHRPKLLLLDDPCLGLDPATRRLLLGELLAASADEGCGILLSTHLLNEAESAIERLVMLDAGRLVLDAPTDEIRARAGSASLEDTFVTQSAAGGSR